MKRIRVVNDRAPSRFMRNYVVTMRPSVRFKRDVPAFCESSPGSFLSFDIMSKLPLFLGRLFNYDSETVNEFHATVNTLRGLLDIMPTDKFKTIRWLVERLGTAIALFSSLVGIFSFISRIRENGRRSFMNALEQEFRVQGLYSYGVNKATILNEAVFKQQLHELIKIKSIYFMVGGKAGGEVSHEDFLAFMETPMVVVGSYEDKPIAIEFQNKDSYRFWWNDGEALVDVVASLNSRLVCSFNDRLIELAQVGSDDTIGYDRVSGISCCDYPATKFYEKHIYDELRKPLERSLELGIKTGEYLYGDPGVSKTTTVYHTLKDLPCLRVRIPPKTYSCAKRILSKISGKKVIILDDIDIEANATKSRENAELLNLLDSNVYDIAILVSNSHDVLPALIRSGRCDIKIKCDVPDGSSRREIFRNLVSMYAPDKADEQLSCSERLIAVTDGFTHADCHNVVMTALRSDLGLVQAAKKVEEYVNSVREPSEGGSDGSGNSLDKGPGTDDESEVDLPI